MENKVRHVIILGVHGDDSFSDVRNKLKGKTGTLEVTGRYGHYLSGRFTSDYPISTYGDEKEIKKLYFFKIRVKDCPKGE